MRTPIIAGNWKMNKTTSEAVILVKDMLKLNDINGVEKVLCPPFVSLASVKQLIANTTIKLGAQNIYYEEKGAYTGEIAPDMVKELCEYVILGHSERRAYFGDSDEVVNKKVHAALMYGLKIMICVGEVLEERESGKTEALITRQVNGALVDVDLTDDIVIAYEPIWAIGTGKAASGEMANETCALIRSTIAQLYDTSKAEAIRIQYGGSVNAANIAEFISQPDIDGALVGGASLKADDFISIVEQSARIKSA
ncbi:triose-phosphate isomerase [Chloroflexota bacterium]